MTNLSFLQNLDLTAHEISVYELLLQEGESTVHDLSAKSKLKRTNLYALLNTLEQKGLVIKREVTRKIHYKPVAPTKLIELAENKYRNMEKTRSDLQSILPALSSSYIRSVEQPIVQIYEGIEGLKEIYLDILKDAKPGYSILQPQDMDKELANWVESYFTKKRARKKMPLKVILTDDATSKKFKKEDIMYYRFSAIVPKNLFPFQHEVTIYGDKVAFLHYKQKDKLIGMVVKHPAFAQTMKAIFDLAWQGASKYTLDK